MDSFTVTASASPRHPFGDILAEPLPADTSAEAVFDRIAAHAALDIAGMEEYGCDRHFYINVGRWLKLDRAQGFSTGNSLPGETLYIAGDVSTAGDIATVVYSRDASFNPGESPRVTSFDATARFSIDQAQAALAQVYDGNQRRWQNVPPTSELLPITAEWDMTVMIDGQSLNRRFTQELRLYDYAGDRFQ